LITLGDQQIKPMDMIRALLKDIPKVPMRQNGIVDRPDITLSDAERAVKDGERIAQIANRGKQPEKPAQA
jgi:hypothetical protein